MRFSISLQETGEPRSWLHFRTAAAGVEIAYGDDDTDEPNWSPVEPEKIRPSLREFAENFEESRAAHSVPPDE